MGVLYSPVWGLLDKLNVVESNGLKWINFGIYLRGPYDEYENQHAIFAPVNDVVSDILFTKMEKTIQTNRKYLGTKGVYVAKQNKKGKLTMVFQESRIRIDVYVGEGYVTDVLELFIEKGERVVAGQHIGEILVGSYCEIFVPYSGVSEKYIEEGSEVKGGVNLQPLLKLY